VLYLASVLPYDITISPNSNGLPGIGQLRDVVVAGRGKVGVLVGLGAAIITGASVTLVNFFWNVGQSV
jgi:hypothetical protein